MNPALLDEDILSAFFAGNIKAGEALLALSDKYDMACSVVTLAEISKKIAPKKRKLIEPFLDKLIQVGLTGEIAKKAAGLCFELGSRKIDFNTCFIAATAHTLHYPIITGNKKRYPMVGIFLEVIDF